MKKDHKISFATRKVLGFLVAKGLLRSNFPPNGTAKLTIKDFLKAAEEIEPRVLAVLPAAIIHFPKAFTDAPNFPEPITKIIDAIVKGEKSGPNLFHVQFEELKRWANAKLIDKRTKPIGKRKARKTYRFDPEVVSKLKTTSTKKRVTETALLEELVREYL
jgi:hypothetical protein